MICAFWKSGDQAEDLAELLTQFESEFGVAPVAAGYDGHDLDVLGGTQVSVNDPSLELCRFFAEHGWEIWS